MADRQGVRFCLLFLAVQDFTIPNRNPGKVGTLKRLIKAAEAQFVTDNAAAAAVAPGTASYTDFLEKMKKEPRKACLLASAPFASCSWALAGACRHSQQDEGHFTGSHAA